MIVRRLGVVKLIPELANRASLILSKQGYASFRYDGTDVFYSPETHDGVAACFHVFRGKRQVLEAYDTGLSEISSDEGIEFDRFRDGSWLDNLMNIPASKNLSKSPRSFSAARKASGYRPMLLS
ncbi:MAG: hypothetical protein Q7R87_02040 [Nanoarchaeota archaeon]|nr:hypothetical protein [Nanoarchaeota archaeon]